MRPSVLCKAFPSPGDQAKSVAYYKLSRHHVPCLCPYQSVLHPQPLKNENWTNSSPVEHCPVDSHLYAERDPHSRLLTAPPQLPPRRPNALDTPLNTSSGQPQSSLHIEEDAGPCSSSALSFRVYRENTQCEACRPSEVPVHNAGLLTLGSVLGSSP